MKGYIYKITNLKNGKFYIGSTLNFENRKKSHLNSLKNRNHHNIHLARAYEKYGEESFVFSYKEIEVEDKKHLQILEERYINFCWNSGKLYNVSKMGSGGDLISYHPNHDEIVKKTSENVKKRYANMSKEERKKMSERIKGKNNPNYGNKWSNEQRKRASLMQKKKVEDGTCPILKLHGKTYEELYGEEKAREMKEKISLRASKKIGEKNPFFGKHHSEETKRKIAEKNRGKKNETQAKKVLYNGVIYESAADCGRKIGISNVTVSYRAKNNIYGFSYIGENDNLPQRQAPIRWTKEMCEEIAKTCKTKKEFENKNVKAYNYVLHNDLMDEFAKKYFIELRHRWSLEEMIELSQKYNSYTDFRKNEPKTITILANHKKWRDEIKKLFNEKN